MKIDDFVLKHVWTIATPMSCVEVCDILDKYHAKIFEINATFSDGSDSFPKSVLILTVKKLPKETIEYIQRRSITKIEFSNDFKQWLFTE